MYSADPFSFLPFKILLSLSLFRSFKPRPFARPLMMTPTYPDEAPQWCSARRAQFFFSIRIAYTLFSSVCKPSGWVPLHSLVTYLKLHLTGQRSCLCWLDWFNLGIRKSEEPIRGKTGPKMPRNKFCQRAIVLVCVTFPAFRKSKK